jgi:peptidylprolyl isomerase
MKKLLLLSAFIITSTLLFAGCGGGSSDDDQAAKDGDIVSVQYTGTLEDGTQFDSSYDRGEPLTFTLGNGEMIPGFENAIRGMKIGEVKTVTLPPEEAYGEYNASLVVTLNRDQFPEGMELTIGQRIPLQNQAGMQFTAVIVEIGESTVTVDANHELVGETLIFEIELVSITPGT